MFHLSTVTQKKLASSFIEYVFGHDFLSVQICQRCGFCNVMFMQLYIISLLYRVCIKSPEIFGKCFIDSQY